jgi:DNA-binding response OmpR family regulator
MNILVVEDDASVARFLERGLVEEGYTVDLCDNGRTAVDQGLAVAYDGVLLDWMLPDLDGLSVLRKWREAGVKTPVIMLTARGGIDATVLGLDAGADDYIEKPFSFEVLLARLRAHLRRATETASMVG